MIDNREGSKFPHEIIPLPEANCDRNEAKVIATSVNGYLFIDDESVTYSIGKDQIITSSEQIGLLMLHYNKRGNVASIDFGFPLNRRRGNFLLSYDPDLLKIPANRQQEIVEGMRFANIRTIRIKGLGAELGMVQLPTVEQPVVEHDLS